MMAGMSVEKTVTLKTSGAKEPVMLETDATIFTVSPTTVAAAAANAGTTVKITYKPVRTGFNRANLMVSTGSTAALVDLIGTCVDRLPVNGAKNITQESFTATWAYVGDDNGGFYNIDVRLGAASIAGYPRAVNARAESYDVTGLDPPPHTHTP